MTSLRSYAHGRIKMAGRYSGAGRTACIVVYGHRVLSVQSRGLCVLGAPII